MTAFVKVWLSLMFLCKLLTWAFYMWCIAYPWVVWQGLYWGLRIRFWCTVATVAQRVHARAFDIGDIAELKAGFAVRCYNARLGKYAKAVADRVALTLRQDPAKR